MFSFFWGQNLYSHFSLQHSTYNPQQKTCSRTHSKGHILVPSQPNILTEMMQPQKRILLTCSNMENLQQQARYIESDEVSDDSMDDNSHMQQGRNFKVKEPKFVDSDVVSADAMGYHYIPIHNWGESLTINKLKTQKEMEFQRILSVVVLLSSEGRLIKASQPNMIWMQICIRGKKPCQNLLRFSI